MPNDGTSKSIKRDKKLEELKVPPHSIEAEQAVLGGLMLDNEAWDKIVDRITDHDFYRHDHRVVFNAINKLSGLQKPFDVITLSETLKEQKIFG